MEYTILVVDDDQAIRDGIEIYLKNEGYSVVKASDGQEAITIISKKQIHLIILDVMMPNLDGIGATFKIREEHNIPIIMLSAKVEETDKILGLSVGADDYISKPFHPLELLARVKSQLRRYMTFGNFAGQTEQQKENSDIVVDGLRLNSHSKQVTVEGDEVKLTPIEFKITQLLMENVGRVFSIDEIYERVWRETAYNADNIVAVHIRKIREKIEVNPKNPKYVKVVWGVGYKIDKS
ncbi:response regulator transcription factor [Kurthia sibirica]|uniref:DNA-binding response regulator n=1 Tax=Kurthia sibirica TaxID=202750 RepID=A0A2U3APY9_9BACL|nr:response regulator transcription factor [Kurthia sibirica]PWI26589.1 DNA-binding response regulator [Kurthia sibirica]GEK32843.1 DNA-binding response regulator [Kurthia sibirica]